MKNMRTTYILAFSAVFAWGTMAPLSKILLTEMTNMEVLGYGSLIGVITLVAVLILSGEYKRLKEYNLKDLGEIFILGLIGYFLYSALYYKGLSILPSQTACILNYLWPIFAVIFSIIFLKEKLKVSSAIAILFSFAGVVIMVFRPGEQLTTDALVGSLLCIAAAALYGLFNILNKRIGKSQIINMIIYISCGAIGGLSFCDISKVTTFTGEQVLGLIWLGVVIDAGGFLLWAIALQKGDTAKISNLAYATPVISMILSMVFLQEPIQLYSIIGISMILGGFLYQLKTKAEAKHNRLTR